MSGDAHSDLVGLGRLTPRRTAGGADPLGAALDQSGRDFPLNQRLFDPGRTPSASAPGIEASPAAWPAS
jgi:hypothetical protein